MTLMTRSIEALPPLESGDRLTRLEFEKRYAAMSRKVKAELIDGIVYMASPVRITQHGSPHALLIAWLAVYASETRGTQVSDNTTLRLDDFNEPQPDALLRLRPEVGGRSRVDENDYLNGGVELVGEIAASSAAYDLHQKKAVYLRHGCLEYVVHVVHEREVRWFALQEGEYRELPADAAGVIRSRVFPGLWLDVPALLASDLSKLLATLRAGLASDEHAAFVKRLG
jgi:hypothetical protein